MTSSNSSKSYGIFYLRKSTVDPDKIPYKLHMKDGGYFSDYLNYSETSEDCETPVSKNTPIYANLDDYLAYLMCSRQPLQDTPM